MEIDDEEDFYSPEPSGPTDSAENQTSASNAPASPPAAVPKIELKEEQTVDTKAELEEGEEEDEGAAMDEDDDSDIDIITERKDGTKAAPPTQTRYSDIKNVPSKTTSNDTLAKSAPGSKSPIAKAVTPAATVHLAVPSADKAAAAASSSKIDVNGNPVHKASGKPITAVNIDEDLKDNEKPWRKPGTDITDYFNYGLDEFTWALYAAKQESMRGDYNEKKVMEDFGGYMMMGGMGNMAGGDQGGGQGGGMGNMPGMEGMTPEMQAIMQQMMATGIDPTQMDPATAAAMFAGMQNQGGNVGGQGGQGQGFGQGGGGYGGNQGQGQYGGFEKQGMGVGGGGGGGGGGGNRGGFGGRGRGGRRW